MLPIKSETTCPSACPLASPLLLGWLSGKVLGRPVGGQIRVHPSSSITSKLHIGEGAVYWRKLPMLSNLTKVKKYGKKSTVTVMLLW